MTHTKRITRSLLDPHLIPLVPRLYRRLRPPRRLPPEAIVVTGHLIAAAGAVGFAFSTRHAAFALLAAAGVILNHVADMLDGTHARATGQCRNGGELLDHFLDPLSFSYWLIGIGVSVQSPYVAMVAVVCVLAYAVLTNIESKLTGEFTLSRVGPTEFKALLATFGIAVAVAHAGGAPAATVAVAASGFLYGLAVLGVGSTIVRLGRSIRVVNERGREPDTSEWISRQAS